MQASEGAIIYYVYRHVRLDTNQPFYVGKGNGDRAYRSKGRNPYWTNVAKKAGYRVEIMLRSDDEKEVFKKEKEFIALYRRCGLPLTNMTDGGEGPTGLKFSEASKLQMSLSRTGIKKLTPHTEEHRAKIRKTLLGHPVSQETRDKISTKNKGKPQMTRRGVSFTVEHCKKLSESHMGNPGYWKGKKLPEHVVVNMSQTRLGKPMKSSWIPVISSDGFIWPSVKVIPKILGISRSKIYKSLKEGIPVDGILFSYLTDRK